MDRTPLGEDTRDRVIALEIQVEHLAEKLDGYGQKVNAMHEAFTQAKGARWVIITLWIGIGAMLANIKVLLAALGVKFGA